MAPIARLTLKNYRCFEDSAPLVFDIDRKITALVGANNSGKSSLLRFFFEFKNLWHSLRSHPHIMQIAREKKLDTSVMGVTEAERVFHRYNDRLLSIMFEFPEEGSPQKRGAHGGTTNRLMAITLTASRTPDPQRGPASLLLSCELRFREPIQVGQEEHFTVGDDHVLGVSGAQARDLADVSPLVSLGNTLCDVKYFPSTRTAVLTHTGTDYDAIIGGEVVARWADWKAGAVPQQKAIERTTRSIERLLGVSRLEITAVKETRTFVIGIDGESFDLKELGAGIAQLIATLTNVTVTNPSIILIDEPELSLHPALQADFVNLLARCSRYGVVFSTHSIGLARTTSNLPFYTVRRERTRSVLCEIGATPHLGRFISEMSFATFNEVGFDRLLMVEGVNEIRTVMAFLDILGIRKRFVFLPLGGGALATGGRDQELAMLIDIVCSKDRIAALVDSERENAGDPPIKDRREFEKSCQDLGFAVCVTKLRAIENYFTPAAVMAEKGATAKALGPYEKPDKTKPLGWGKSEGYKIAAKMTRADLENTDVGQFLLSL